MCEDKETLVDVPGFAHLAQRLAVKVAQTLAAGQVDQVQVAGAEPASGLAAPGVAFDEDLEQSVRARRVLMNGRFSISPVLLAVVHEQDHLVEGPDLLLLDVLNGDTLLGVFFDF